MQITVNRTELSAAITWAARGIAKRPCVPVLGGMRVEVAGGRLTVAAFDYETTAAAHVFGDSAQPGVILVDGKQLTAAVKSLPKGKTVRADLAVADEPHVLEIRCDGTVTRLAAMDSGDYPQLPAMPPIAGVISGDAFARSFTRVAASAGTDGTLPVLTCVRVTMSSASLELAATDRYRLGTDTVSWTPQDLDADEQSFNVPAAIVAAFVKAAKGAGKVAMHYLEPDVPASERGFGGTGGMAGFATDERELIVRCNLGEFPKYRALFPAESASVVTADAAQLVTAVTRAAAMLGRHGVVDLAITGTGITVTAKDHDGNDAAVQTLPCALEGDDVTTRFNAGYLASVAEGVTGTVRLGFSGTKPVDVTSAGDDSYRALVCPVRIAS